jgi:hypothetical protein
MLFLWYIMSEESLVNVLMIKAIYLEPLLCSEFERVITGRFLISPLHSAQEETIGVRHLYKVPLEWSIMIIILSNLLSNALFD